MTTIRDVSERAGVGVGTVSRYLNKGSVSAATRQRIEEAIAELGFQPNAMARGIRAGVSGLVGCLVSDIASPLYAGVVRSLETALRERGYTLVLANSHGNAELELKVATQFVERRLEGLVFAPVQEAGSQAMALLRRAGTPVVTLDRLMEDPADCVLVDHRQGVQTATRHLLSLGHRRIALLTLGGALRSAQGRLQGFRDAYAEYGLRVDDDLVRAEGGSVDAVFSTTLSLFERPDAPSAVLCLGTRMLGGVLRAIRHSGRVMPTDVSVVCLGDSDLAQYGDPAVTTVRWNADELGALAAGLLIERMSASGPAVPRKVLVTTELVLRDSTAQAADARAQRLAPMPGASLSQP